MKILTDEDIEDCFYKSEKWIEFARAVEAKIMERIGEPVAFITYKGYLLHADDPKVAEHSEPEPLFAIKGVE